MEFEVTPVKAKPKGPSHGRRPSEGVGPEGVRSSILWCADFIRRKACRRGLRLFRTGDRLNCGNSGTSSCAERRF